MTYEEWEKEVAAEIKRDALWSVTAYRLALFASDLGWRDAGRLARDRRALGLSDQLVRAVGSISANLAEGYSRGTGKDRARFFEYSLGSARESRDWYFKARHVLGHKVYQHRLGLLTRIIQLWLKMVPQQRGRTLHERSESYQPDASALTEPDTLLANVPLPDLNDAWDDE